jgi:hypothetical protein
MNPILSTVLIVLGVVALVAAVTWTLAGRWLRHQHQRWRWHATHQASTHDAPTTQQAQPSAPKRVIVPPPLSSLPPPTMSVKRRYHSDDTPTRPMAHVSAISAAPASSTAVDVALHG